jgi:hypothetical protein
VKSVLRRADCGQTVREDDEEWGDEARSLELARDQWTGWGVETTSMRRRMEEEEEEEEERCGCFCGHH